MVRKIPYRKCVATQESHPKKDLIRVVKTPDGQVIVDQSGKANGRGAYIKRSREALAIAIKKKALSRALEIEIPQAVYDQLYAMFNDE